MEQDSASSSGTSKNKIIHRIAATALVFFSAIAAVTFVANAQTGGKHVQKSAQQYIADFRRGEEFNSNESVTHLVKTGRLDKFTLSALTKELATGTPEVRENIVKLLEKIGKELDPPRSDKFQVVRDHGIIRALAVEGFIKNDAAGEVAAGVLRNEVMPADLASANEVYLKSLQKLEGDYINIAAKAKTLQAKPYVERMAAMPDWQQDEEEFKAVRIAQAALGNIVVEDEFHKATRDAEKNAPPAPPNRFYDVGAAKDGTALAARLDELGRIGTKRSLLLVCTYLRSTMKSYVPQVSERSIRYAAADAIRFNYPDERLLYNPSTQAEWSAVEKFCTQHIGAVFDGPTPNIPPDQAYPRMPQQPD